jgi:hypothetical protein
MVTKKYELSYLPLFYEDLSDVLHYIQYKLKSPQAATELLTETEKAILKSLSSPLGYKPYPANKRRDIVYYPIFVKNYLVSMLLLVT